MGLIELTGFGSVLRLIGVLFWVIVIAALIAALWLPKTWKGKTAAVLVVVGLFAAFPGRWAWEVKQKQDVAQARYEKAEAKFQERCKKSGVFIHRTAENVEGIFLLKLRPDGLNYGNQYRMDDPYGSDFLGEGYIEFFLRERDESGLFNITQAGGYGYADAIDPKDGQRYRYTGRIDQPWLHDKRYGEWVRNFVLDKVPTSDPAPRYGVTYDDISTREDRDYWIAGSSLRVIDLQTNEVMAERIGYMMDRGQGSDPGGRSPWQSATYHACPPFPGRYKSLGQLRQTRNFVEDVLHIKQNRKDN